MDLAALRRSWNVSMSNISVNIAKRDDAWCGYTI